MTKQPSAHADDIFEDAKPQVWVWINAASHGDFLAVPVLYRVLIANCIFILAGAFLGTALVTQTRDPNLAPVLVGFTVTGLFLSIVVNFVLLKIAFLPLTRLRDTMRLVEKGNMNLRAPITGYDPDADELAATFNHMINKVDELSRSRAAQILQAQEEERKRIARELHDETGQALSSLLITLAMIENVMTEEPQRAQMAEARNVAHGVLRAIRNMSIDLRPSALDDLGLIPALRQYIREYQQKTGVSVELAAHGVKDRYSSEIETALYRIVQEALTNVMKHAHATKVAVIFKEEQNTANITIQDNGQGFDLSALNRSPTQDRGLGIIGMRERIALINGSFSIESHIGKGTTINITAPLYIAVGD